MCVPVGMKINGDVTYYLVARGLHFINFWINKMPRSEIQIANTKSIGLTE